MFDYSVALGIPGQVDDPRVRAFVETRRASSRATAGKAVGTTAMTREQVERLTGSGVNVLLYGADTWLAGKGRRTASRCYGHPMSDRADRAARRAAGGCA